MSVQPTIPLGPSDDKVRWADLRAWLHGQIATETPVMEGFRGEITGAASGGMVTAYRNTLARMNEAEASR